MPKVAKRPIYQKSGNFGVGWDMSPARIRMNIHGKILRIAAGYVGGAIVLAMLAGSALPQPSSPPAELTALERQVSLKIAHVRIKGPTNAADLKQLSEAQRVQLEGEKAIASGDFKQAEQDFLRANVLISAIAE